MKQITLKLCSFFCLALIITSCKLSTEEVISEVKKGLIENMQKEGIEGVVITNLELTHKSDSIYTGIIEMAADGETLKAPIDVIYNGNKVTWNVREEEATIEGENNEGPQSAINDVIAQIQNELKVSITESYLEEGINVEITDIVLQHDGDENFSGIIESTTDGEAQRTGVKVKFDGTNISWELEE